uniref:Cytochrome P450 CYP417B1 n=1 Tax=Nilaparvata lugens TaxID=108931 RepID=A0A0K0LBC2_NILLU|nr:cytochrome P450 CYP417B1 [Nilaparvata lugens]AIW80016.1 cytochrome P450 CYP417B1 [Nilaparvata lugens]AIW80017.1 cytochrome P450 CYP417B1-3 [Nilaparvata lugens]
MSTSMDSIIVLILDNIWTNVHYTFLKMLLYFVALMGVIVIYHFWRLHRLNQQTKEIKGLPSLPFIGNAYLLLGLKKAQMTTKVNEIISAHGSILRFWMGPFLWIVVSEPNYLEAIMTSEYATNKSESYQFFRFQADGIFIASGQNWRRLRKIVLPSFHQRLMRNYFNVFKKESLLFTSLLEKEVDKGIFDMHDYVSKLTMDILCGTLMGVESREQTDGNMEFAKNLQLSTVIIKERHYKFHLGFDFIYKMTDGAKKEAQYNTNLHNYVIKIINQRKKLMNELKDKKADDNYDDDDLGRPSYLDVMLSQYEGLSDKEIAIKITDMFIAGSDTTAIAISYSFLLMGMYPEVQEKVYREVIDVMEYGDFEIEKLSRLHYLEMVIKEVLRLYTIPCVVRKLEKELKIGSTVFPAGTRALLSLYAVHRNPKYWSNPLEFHPDHFLPENVSARPKYSYIPFNMGPRNCPGQLFAMLSMKTVIGYAIREYVFHSDLKLTDLEYTDVFMLESENGYPVKITKR